MSKPARRLKVGQQGEVQLPPDVLEALGVQAGGELDLVVDAKRKSLRLERHVEDPWGEALKEKAHPDLEDLMASDKRRAAAAREAFEAKLKDPPKSRPEDRPDAWR